MAGLKKIVFVGNLPYSHSDDLQNQLEQVFATVGPVSNFRITFKKETGKPRGYGFCEYFDTQTADSAIQNLQGSKIGGRALRLDFADFGNHDTRDAGRQPPPVKGRRSGGGGQSGGGDNMSNEPNGSSARNSGPITTGLPPDLPCGQPLAAGQSATDQISQTLAAIPPAQLAEITGQMKQLVASAPDQARQLLNVNPQLTYALFQAMLMMDVVDASILTRMLAPAAMQKQQQQQQQPIPKAAMPSHQMPVGFGANAYAQQPMRPGGMAQQPSYSTPLAPLPNYGIMPQQAAPQPVQPAPVIPQQQQPQQNTTTAAAQQQAQLIQQVLSLTPQQINALAPEHRATILQIRQQALSNMTGG
ncbi:hypothetical protein MJO28_001162 [Puccinia striiformis f. sp. tritici]|uniref:Uncharacterized protein n=1 Tax=Puccinia striiformis f. sp. tritici TaxID=168172 RepID=A0ACC0F2K8_9BASI|nr:hypothetical protein MJO28_001162 [Puccinia striiformis f. sp. tritici]